MAPMSGDRGTTDGTGRSTQAVASQMMMSDGRSGPGGGDATHHPVPLRPIPAGHHPVSIDITSQLLPPSRTRVDGSKSEGDGGGSDGEKGGLGDGGYRPERYKTGVAFLAIAFSGFFNFFLLTIIHDIVPRKPLPDLVFMLVEQQPWAMFAGDLCAGISVCIAFALIVMHRYRWIIFRRLFLLAGFLYGLRATVLAVTFLPPSFANHSSICLPAEEKIDMYNVLNRFKDYVLTLGLTSKSPKILCGDLMFSGHTTSLTLMYFILIRYSPRRLWLLRWAVAPMVYFGIAALVLSGGHYTMDVLIAYWLSSHMFWSYHQIFESKRAGRSKQALTWMWWYWVSVWFEANVPEGRLKNELEFPLPWPPQAVTAVERLSQFLNHNPSRNSDPDSESGPGAGGGMSLPTTTSSPTVVTGSNTRHNKPPRQTPRNLYTSTKHSRTRSDEEAFDIQNAR